MKGVLKDWSSDYVKRSVLSFPALSAPEIAKLFGATPSVC